MLHYYEHDLHARIGYCSDLIIADPHYQSQLMDSRTEQSIISLTTSVLQAYGELKEENKALKEVFLLNLNIPWSED